MAGTLHRNACGADMPASSVIFCDLAYIHQAFRAKAHFEFLRSQLVEEDSDFDAFCHAELAYDPFKIGRRRVEEVHGLFPDH